MFHLPDAHPDQLSAAPPAELDGPIESIVLHEVSLAKNAIAEATERGEACSLEGMDLPSVVTVIDAVQSFGDTLHKKLGVDEETVERTRQESMAYARYKSRQQLPTASRLLELDPATVERIEHDADTKYAQNRHEEVVGDGARPEFMATTYKDERYTDSILFASDVVDPEALKVMAMSLDEMATNAKDPSVSYAAVLALEQLAQDTHNEPIIDAVTHPERLKRVKLAGMLGPWAGRLAARVTVAHAFASA